MLSQQQLSLATASRPLDYAEHSLGNSLSRNQWKAWEYLREQRPQYIQSVLGIGWDGSEFIGKTLPLSPNPICQLAPKLEPSELCSAIANCIEALAHLNAAGIEHASISSDAIQMQANGQGLVCNLAQIAYHPQQLSQNFGLRDRRAFCTLLDQIRAYLPMAMRVLLTTRESIPPTWSQLCEALGHNLNSSISPQSWSFVSTTAWLQGMSILQAEGSTPTLWFHGAAGLGKTRTLFELYRNLSFEKREAAVLLTAKELLSTSVSSDKHLLIDDFHMLEAEEEIELLGVLKKSEYRSLAIASRKTPPAGLGAISLRLTPLHSDEVLSEFNQFGHSRALLKRLLKISKGHPARLRALLIAAGSMRLHKSHCTPQNQDRLAPELVSLPYQGKLNLALIASFGTQLPWVEYRNLSYSACENLLQLGLITASQAGIQLASTLGQEIIASSIGEEYLLRAKKFWDQQQRGRLSYSDAQFFKEKEAELQREEESLRDAQNALEAKREELQADTRKLELERQSMATERKQLDSRAMLLEARTEKLDQEYTEFQNLRSSHGDGPLSSEIREKEAELSQKLRQLHEQSKLLAKSFSEISEREEEVRRRSEELLDLEEELAKLAEFQERQALEIDEKNRRFEKEQAAALVELSKAKHELQPRNKIQSGRNRAPLSLRKTPTTLFTSTQKLLPAHGESTPAHVDPSALTSVEEAPEAKLEDTETNAKADQPQLAVVVETAAGPESDLAVAVEEEQQQRAELWSSKEMHSAAAKEEAPIQSPKNSDAESFEDEKREEARSQASFLEDLQSREQKSSRISGENQASSLLGKVQEKGTEEVASSLLEKSIERPSSLVEVESQASERQREHPEAEASADALSTEAASPETNPLSHSEKHLDELSNTVPGQEGDLNERALTTPQEEVTPTNAVGTSKARTALEPVDKETTPALLAKHSQSKEKIAEEPVLDRTTASTEVLTEEANKNEENTALNTEEKIAEASTSDCTIASTGHLTEEETEEDEKASSNKGEELVEDRVLDRTPASTQVLAEEANKNEENTALKTEEEKAPLSKGEKLAKESTFDCVIASAQVLTEEANKNEENTVLNTEEKIAEASEFNCTIVSAEEVAGKNEEAPLKGKKENATGDAPESLLAKVRDDVSKEPINTVKTNTIQDKELQLPSLSPAQPHKPSHKTSQFPSLSDAQTSAPSPLATSTKSAPELETNSQIDFMTFLEERQAESNRSLRSQSGRRTKSNPGSSERADDKNKNISLEAPELVLSQAPATEDLTSVVEATILLASLNADADEELEELEAVEKLEADEQIEASQQLELTEQLEAVEKLEADEQIEADEELEADEQIEASQQLEAVEKLEASEQTEADKELEAVEKLEAPEELEVSGQLEADEELEAAKELEVDEQLEADEQLEEPPSQLSPLQKPSSLEEKIALIDESLLHKRIRQALHASSFNPSRAATKLGVSRETFYQLLRETKVRRHMSFPYV